MPVNDSTKLRRLGFILWLFFVAYTIESYLLFLRDDFLLERISFLTNTPELLELGRRWAQVLHVNSVPTPPFFLIVTGMFVVYAKALRLVRSINHKRTDHSATNIVLASSAAFLTTTFLSFPILSTDVFDYIASNRVLFEHRANPWLATPQDFPGDEFIWLGSWSFRASVYGPVQFLFSSVVHLLARESIIANIIGFKLSAAVFTMATIWLVRKWLMRFANENLLYGLAIFAWNPLLHIEIIGNAHNDIIMAFFAFVSFYWFSQKRRTLAALTLSLAVLAKIAAGLYAPIMAVWLLMKKGLHEAVRYLLAFTIMTGVGFATLGDGLGGFINNLGVQFGLYLRSLPTILRFLFLKAGFSEINALIWEKLFTVPPLIVFLFSIGRRIQKLGLLTGLVMGMLGYLLIVSPMLQPWYLVWVLPFIALLTPGRLQTGALTLTWSSLLHYGVLFISYYFSPLHFAWQIALFATIVIPPLLVWFLPQTWYTHLGVGSRE